MNYKDIASKGYSRAIIMALTKTYGEDKVSVVKIGYTDWVRVESEFVFNATFNLLQSITNDFVIYENEDFSFPLSLIQKKLETSFVPYLKAYFKWLKRK